MSSGSATILPDQSVVDHVQGNHDALAAKTEPTESHALAAADHEDKGLAQVEHQVPEIKDLGWNDEPTNVPSPLVGGVANEQLWQLIRRFDKQMYHVKAISHPPPGDLDLNIADEEEFSPDKLRSNIERFYMTVVIGFASFSKHIARIRSWNEWQRTTAFCVAYFIAWIFDFLVVLLASTLIVLIAVPASRPLLFPPAPLPLIDSKTGELQKPKAGIYGSDSLSGAPEQHEGEAVEQEASNFVTGVASVALSSAAGKHPQNEVEDTDGAIDSTVPDPTNFAQQAADAQKSSNGTAVTAHHDKTKKPVEAAIWEKTRPIMRVIADLADTWERFANALSATPPFPAQAPRLRLASLLVPLIFLGMFVTSTMFVKGTTFGVGGAFFGQPLIDRGLAWLNHNYPHWQRLLEVRNSILKGIPTNAQLTLTLLRIGEKNKAPLPPPPTSTAPPPDKPKSVNEEDLPMAESKEHVDSVVSHSSDHKAKDTHGEQHVDKKKKEADAKKQKHGSKVLGIFRFATRTGVETILGTDRLKAVAGSEHSKNRLGVLPNPDNGITSGPIDFESRYKGKKGFLYVSTKATTPCVSFGTVRSYDKETVKPVVSIGINEIRELRKVGGLGWKAKLVVGWAMNREIADGLQIINDKGESFTFTAIQYREALFNRLVALGDQKWESW